MRAGRPTRRRCSRSLRISAGGSANGRASRGVGKDARPIFYNGVCDVDVVEFSFLLLAVALGLALGWMETKR